MEIPPLNLFMMCTRPRPQAFRPLPQGYHTRLCRPEELELWGRMNLDDPAYPDYMMEYFNQVYAPRRQEFFQRCTFVCDADDHPIATCFLWPAYKEQLHTLHWFKVLPAYEGQGIGRGLLTHLLENLTERDYPIFLHTHPHCYRAVGLYADFGFRLLSGPPVGTRSNDWEEGLPWLRKAMPAAVFSRIQITPAPAHFLEVAGAMEQPEF